MAVKEKLYIPDCGEWNINYSYNTPDKVKDLEKVKEEKERIINNLYLFARGERNWDEKKTLDEVLFKTGLLFSRKGMDEKTLEEYFEKIWFFTKYKKINRSKHRALAVMKLGYFSDTIWI